MAIGIGWTLYFTPEDIFPLLPARLNTMEEKGKKRGGAKSTRRGREDDATVVVSTSSVAFLFEEEVCFFLSIFLSRIFCLSFLKIVEVSNTRKRADQSHLQNHNRVRVHWAHTHTYAFAVKEFIIHSHLLLA